MGAVATADTEASFQPDGAFCRSETTERSSPLALDRTWGRCGEGPKHGSITLKLSQRVTTFNACRSVCFAMFTHLETFLSGGRSGSCAGP